MQHSHIQRLTVTKVPEIVHFQWFNFFFFLMTSKNMSVRCGHELRKVATANESAETAIHGKENTLLILHLIWYHSDTYTYIDIIHWWNFNKNAKSTSVIFNFIGKLKWNYWQIQSAVTGSDKLQIKIKYNNGWAFLKGLKEKIPLCSMIIPIMNITFKRLNLIRMSLVSTFGYNPTNGIVSLQSSNWCSSTLVL